MAIPPDVEMTPLRSSNVKEAGYDEEAKVLYVSFNSGGNYAYDAVDSATFQDLLTSNSPGGFVNRFLKATHESRRV